MPKAASPVRLEDSLMKAATAAGSTLNRSAAQQVEYWAGIGRKVSKILDPMVLLEINAGLVKIRIEESPNVAVSSNSVFDALERDRESGALAESIAADTIRYQASSQYPGQLEQISPDGSILVGQFSQGKFCPRANT